MSLFAGVVRLLFGPVYRIAKRHVEADPEYQAQIKKLEESYKLEETLIEEAEWIGTTGLAEDVERELPKYLRRELGELVLDDDSLKARDLRYIGSFQEDGLEVHYWNVPYRDEKDVYAYVEVSEGQETCTGWGDRKPPTAPAL